MGKMHAAEFGLKACAISGHAAVAAMNIVLLLTDRVPYPSLVEGLADLQYIFHVVTVVLEFCMLFMNVFGECKCIEGCYKKAFMIVYILFVIALGALIWATFAVTSALFKSDIRKTVEDKLYMQVTELYGMPDYTAITDAINELQITGKCCGAEDYFDFYNSSFASLPMYGGRVLPVTCFKIPEDGFVSATPDEIDESKIYIEGCNDALVEQYNTFFNSLWLSIFSGFVPIFDVVLRVWLMCLLYKANKVGDPEYT